MGDSCTTDLLKVLLRHKSVPVPAQSLLVEIRVNELSVGVLVHNLVQVVTNIHLVGNIHRYLEKVVKGHLFEELGCDPWFKKKPTSSIHASDLSILAVKASGWTEEEKGENWEKGELVHAGQDVTDNYCSQ